MLSKNHGDTETGRNTEIIFGIRIMNYLRVPPCLRASVVLYCLTKLVNPVFSHQEMY